MDVLGLLTNKKEKEAKNHIQHLIALAAKDGHISDSEKSFLETVGLRFNLSKANVDKLIAEFNPNDALDLPADKDEKFEQLFDMATLVHADGVVSEEEIDFCIEVATNLGFKQTIVGALVRKMILSIESGHSKEDIKTEVGPFLSY